MRRMLVLSVLGSVAVLTGCASTAVTPYANVDFQHVARVENAAKAMGVQVYWLNYPTKTQVK